jgi:hypothetical protein
VCAQGPWVELAFAGVEWPVTLQANAASDLQAGLHLRGIGVCTLGLAPPGSAPVARITLSLNDANQVVVGIHIQDAMTDKQVARSVDLRTVSPDARALALAQSIDELLRASWIELTIHEPPPSAPPIPEEVQRAIEPKPVPAERLQVLGARFASELYTGGVKLLGADALVVFWLQPRLAFSFALGLRAGLRVDSPHGSIGVSALTASTGLVFPLWPRSARYNLLVHLGGHLAEMTVTGRGAAPTVARTHTGFLVGARFGISGTWRLTEVLRAELTLGPGVALHGVAAKDGLAEVMSTGGVELHGALGIGGLF